MKYKIYKLVYNNEVIYIGRTIQKLKYRKTGGYYKIIDEIIKDCIIELIEETDDVSRERYWISYYRNNGCVLYNIENGDTGLSEKEYYQNNKEHISKITKEYYQNNKEHIKEYKKKYIQKNKENIKEYKKKYYEKNKEIVTEKNKIYVEKNKEKIKEYKKNYYEKKKLLQN